MEAQTYGIEGILGKKLGMTQIFKETGKSIPVTVIEAGPCYIIQIKNKSKDGYSALRLGFDPQKEKKTKKPELGVYKKINVSPQKFMKEIRISDDKNEKYKLGDKVCADIFNPGDFVDISGTSIGCGFQGGMKRWGWKGGPKGHGSMFHRRVGSIGSGSADPSRVFKGQHMPGHMGAAKITIQNLEVVEVDTANNIIVIKGAVPGHKNNYLVIKKAKKRKSGSAQILKQSQAAVKEEPHDQKSETKKPKTAS